MKKHILIIAGFYLPSVKGGGPIQSIKNLVDNLEDDYDFYILANDRDLGDQKPFENILHEEWITTSSGKVYYINTSKLSLKRLLSIIKPMDFNILYLNSFFSFKLSILPIILIKFGLLKFEKVIVAPRGNFSKGALQLKSYKKKLYIEFSKILNLYNNIIFHATAVSEKEDIDAVFGDKTKITIANNLTANYENLNLNKELEKFVGELKIVFISRVHPKKNLKKALEILRSIEGKVELNIYGPIEDKNYWEECKKVILSLPSNIIVNYRGVVKHDEIMNIFTQHHVFLFPTMGENFGHVISEALIGGCPVIISDQTPWRDLTQLQVGWDISLKDEKKFIEAIQTCVDFNEYEYKEMSINAFDYGKQSSNRDFEIQKYLKLFNHI